MSYLGSGPTRFNTADDLTVTDDAEIQDNATVGGDLTVTGTTTLNGTVNGVDKIEEGNSSVEVVDTGTGYITHVVDGTERLRVNSAGLDVNGNVVVGTNDSIFAENNLRFKSSGAAYIDHNTVGQDINFRVSNASSLDTTGAVITSGGNLQFNSGYGSAATAYGCRAWVNFNGTGTVAIRGSGNVSSITDDGTGLYTLNFSTSMPDANYAAVSANRAAGGAGDKGPYAYLYSSSNLKTSNYNATGGLVDNSDISWAIFR